MGCQSACSVFLSVMQWPITAAISAMVIPPEADLRLFQNRYKSIVCDEDSYFPELVRYIHLNPLRAKLVKNLT